MAVLLYHYKLSCIILGLAIFSFTVLVVLKTTAYYTGNSGNTVIISVWYLKEIRN